VHDSHAQHQLGLATADRPKRLRHWATCVAFLTACSCAPVNPSATALVGRWKVVWSCGSEVLDLNADGTYAYAVDFADGGRSTDAGRWKMVPSTARLSGAKVVLQNALETCSPFGDKVDRSKRRDRELETIWEWGRTILSFNPDVQGFTRVKR